MLPAGMQGSDVRQGFGARFQPRWLALRCKSASNLPGAVPCVGRSSHVSQSRFTLSQLRSRCLKFGSWNDVSRRLHKLLLAVHLDDPHRTTPERCYARLRIETGCREHLWPKVHDMSAALRALTCAVSMAEALPTAAEAAIAAYMRSRCSGELCSRKRE